MTDTVPVLEGLEPCPFCGGDNVETFGPYGWYRQWGISHSCKSFYSGTSEFFQGFRTAAEAIAAWNTRPLSTALGGSASWQEALLNHERDLADRDDRIAALREALERIAHLRPSAHFNVSRSPKAVARLAAEIARTALSQQGGSQDG